jgi:dimeric dUTPase (all-alpha-NTP-PPase superfamily)
MNLTKLFETQKVLHDRIGYSEPDRFNKLILALLVELGECANEWRGFKFWSQDQQPRVLVTCENCDGGGVCYPFIGTENSEHEVLCDLCSGEGTRNLLLEEYVDGLHFVLELGLEFGQINRYKYYSDAYIEESVTDQFRTVFFLVSESFLNEYPEEWFNPLFTAFVELGKMLGFTWEQIEQAYFTKNAVNHQRQENGY